MTEFKNTAHELRLFRMRLLAASVLVLVCFSLLLARFLWLQVVRHDAYAAQAEENRISVVPIVPNRGLILDRNGVVLARNYSAYTLEITPSKIKTNIDDLIDELGTIVEIQQRDRRRFRRLQEESKNFESVPIRTRLTDEEVAKFTAQRYRFPGVEVQARLFRQYPYGKTAAHVIGYIGRISQRDAERIADSDDEANYNGTDYIGKEGLEKSYESQLHGTTGYEEVEISASGRAVRSLSRTPATPGKNLILSIDIELQKVVEEAFGDQKGALVAINPATGDILAYVSQPSYDPNLFVEGIDQQSWDELNKSPDRPLLNRPLSGLYSPGSTYKPFMALAALELGKRRPQDAIRDPGFFVLGNHRFRDDKEGGHGVVDMYRSIAISCDTYYYMLANDMGVNAIHDFMKPFGFGQITGIDLEHEKRGILPSTEWKRTAFRKPEQKRWIAGDTVSLGIGQGYNSFTPLQLAQATSILANNGVVMKPHLVKIIEDGVSHERTETVPKESYRIPLKQENIDFIKRAMVGVVKEGTGAAAFRGAPYESGGKTGTAQVVNIAKNQKYDSKKLSRIYHDNGLYIGFAPADAPRIAIAAVVENGGWGAGVAAPLVRKAMDYFMLGKRPNEPIKSVAPEAVSPDTPVEGPTSEDAGSSNTPTVQPDVQE
ncbi:penicillin-binding protein 2 [Herbaspirillum huttiense F1]|jgi:peptidoglycan glycosyltransferase (EC 2.4.1.129)/cell elongation-specific peptidoglycan D,D-transpeptidase|uniref:Peptidoglycan D,D-transpeptidase MrdA n=4 Tax=Pseudomonadota TaxID=1224 RepID=A0AAJ2LSX2_9BURK|nr:MULTISPECIES: penicillin-binding protein 2 [Herbaspirillum]MBN9356473.1 penicillin-binding protein 2 [Herbaspirillum huttiense]MBP1317158.1 penicillin-binding protein 2 [Herbaspirillum sp. 1130]MDR6741615.1 penicillin-binding protein 2 [Herbaspirillum sp. 1173]MDR9835655.1 penicillin-binding protein 2 [Herbaspirillum huttiense]MDR9849320.1 penicillin-binding protein 2 [Herbaspirillum huttiense SE1]